MANRLKMEQRQLLFALFSQNWSIRKINKVIGIHRKTITRYRHEWLKKQQQIESSKTSPQGAAFSNETSIKPVQSVPLSRNQLPPEGVVHF